MKTSKKKGKMKYYANYNANDGTRMEKDITGTNKKEIIRIIRDIANGERYTGHSCTWTVYDQHGHCAAKGGTYDDGKQYRIDKHYLRMFDR